MARDPGDPGTRETAFARKRAAKKALPASKASAIAGERIGYARKSKDEQDLALQVDALKRAGCSRVYVEQVSRAGPRREKKGATELAHALMALRPGDTLVVWRLDRLGRSLKDLIQLAEQLDAAGIGLRSLHDAIDIHPGTVDFGRQAHGQDRIGRALDAFAGIRAGVDIKLRVLARLVVSRR